MKNIMFILTFSVSSIILFANPWDGKDPYNIIVEGINSTYPDGVEYTSKYEEDDVRREDREIGQAEGAPAFIYDYKGKVVVQTTATYRYDLILCSDDEIIHYNIDEGHIELDYPSVIDSNVLSKQIWYSKEEYNKLQLMINKLSKISGIDIAELEKELFGDDQ